MADSLPDLAPLKPGRGELSPRRRSRRCWRAPAAPPASLRTSSSPPGSPTPRPAESTPVEFCEREEIELVHVTPGLAGRFLRDLPVSAATKNQALTALRHFFDALVTRHAVVLNPFHSVRGIQHQVLDGKTPEISLSQARRLFAAMLKRRLAAAGLPDNLTPHSFRVMVVTALLSQNVPVEEVQHLVGHSHPSTTQLYDRRRRRINRSIVERIPF